MTVVIIGNPDSGPGDSQPELAEFFAGEMVIDCEADSVRRQIDQALRGEWTHGARPDAIGVCGGDGTIGLVAQHLLELDPEMALLPIPGGTHNHFCRDLGIVSVADAASALEQFRSGLPARRVDVGQIGDRIFLNTCSVGAYPSMVEARDQYPQWLPKPVATVVASAIHAVRATSMTITIREVPLGHESLMNQSGTVDQAQGQRRMGYASASGAAAVDVLAGTHRIWILMAGNGRYGEALSELGHREQLNGGMLDVHLVRAAGAASRLRVLGAVLMGRLGRSSLIRRASVEEFDLRRRGRGGLKIALDGEVVELHGPQTLRCWPRALGVIAPSEVDEALGE